MMFEFAEEAERLAVIKVAGIGGAGGNAVGRMIEANLTGVEFLAVNTDLQALKESQAHNPLQIGAQLTKGLGSGGNPAVGQAAAEEDRKTIAAAVAGADMVFVTAGMGGGTGTGAAAVVADIARDEGALTVGIVTRPFQFEGQVRGQQAEEGIRRLQQAVDTLIVIPNQRLLEVVPPNTSMQEAFRIADNVLYEATRGIYEIITRHDHVNLDFADVRSVMKDMGVAIMGTGRAEGENRAVEAAKAAISSPLLEDVEIAGSKAVLVNVLGREVELHDTAAAMQYIQDAAGPQAHVIFGYGLDESLGDTLQVTVIATGFRDAASTGYASAQALHIATEPKGDLPDNHPDSHPDNPADDLPSRTVDDISVPPHETRGEVLADPVPADQLSAEAEAEAGAEQPEPVETPLRDDDLLTFADDPVPEVPAWASEAVVAEEAPWPDDSEDAHEAFPAAGLEPEIPPAPLADHVAEDPLPPADPLRRDFLTRVAVDGGADREATESFLGTSRSVPLRGDDETPAAAAAAPSTERSITDRFLRRVGRRNIGEVEVPDGAGGPVQPSRSVASGLQPGDPNDDLTAPAYTRKYMD